MNFDNNAINAAFAGGNYKKHIEKLYNLMKHNKIYFNDLLQQKDNTIESLNLTLVENKKDIESLNLTLVENKKDIEFKNRYINELKQDLLEKDLEIFKLNEKILELNKNIEFFKNKTYKRTIVFNEDGCIHDESINIDN
jgi:uncharacterized coiled-coil protein SlyX